MLKPTDAQKSGRGGLHEAGDRWMLDMLIPQRDRVYLGPQFDPQTLGVNSISPQQVATQAIVVIDSKVPSCRRGHMPIHSAQETGLEYQTRMRLKHTSIIQKHTGDSLRADDRLL